MSDTSVETESRKEALKKLKAARKEQIAATTARMKEQRRAVKAIKEHLAGAGADGARDRRGHGLAGVRGALVRGLVKEIWRNSGRAKGWQLLSLPAGASRRRRKPSPAPAE